MYSSACTLFGLLAVASAGLLAPNPPSNVYLPVSSTQQQTNTLTKTSYTVPTVVTSHQIPVVSSVFHQQIPSVSSAIHQQIPQVRNSVVNTAQISTEGAPSTFLQQYPQTAQQVSIHAQSSQPIQIQSIPSSYQQFSNIASQQSSPFRQSNFGAQHYSSSVNTIRTSQPAHTNAAAVPSFNAASFQHQVPIKEIAIVRLANENVGDGTYSFNYETENGITAEEHGQANAAGADIVERVQGSYSYTGPDGVRYAINYVADENGYRAAGAHLPVPPEPTASVSQVSTTTSQINSNLIGSRSAGVHVIPTTVVSQPIQIVQNPGIQSQSQLRSSYYQQSPVIQSSKNVYRQATVVPSGTVSNVQQISADSLQNQNKQVSSFVQHSSTGSSSQQSGRLQAQVLQRQSAVAPYPFIVQSSAPSHQAISKTVHTVVVPATTVSVQQGSTQQSDAVQTQVHQQQSTIVPSAVAVQNSAAGHAGVSGNAQSGYLRQSIVPANTVSVQHGASGYSTQQIAVGSLSAQQQGGLHHQTSAAPVLQQGAGFNAQQFGQQAFQAQQDVQNKVSFGFVTGQQGQYAQQSQAQNLVAPINSDSVQQSTANEHSGIVVQSAAGPSGAFIQQGVAANNAYRAVQQSQVTVPSSGTSIQQGIAANNVYRAVQQSQVAVPSSGTSIQQGIAANNVYSAVQQNQAAVPSSRTSIQQGVVANNVYSAVQQSQGAVPVGIVPVHLGRTGLIKQQNSVYAQQASQRQTSGVSSSHVTVQLGTAGYATEQVGDVSSVQVFGGSSVENAAVPSQTLSNGQQVSQQTGASSNVISSNVSEQQTTSTINESTVSPGVVLPDGSVHSGY